MIVEWAYAWALPGHGAAYWDCGHWRLRGCPNVDDHTQQGLDEARAGKIYVEQYHRSCFRAECPICYESWAGKEAGKIAHRLEFGPRNRKVIHLIVSPPVEFWIRHDYKQLRKRAYEVAKSRGFKGGSCVFHPFRMDEKTNGWYFSPHFHMLGFGWIENVDEGFQADRWIVKNKGVRKSVFASAQYLLSHAGVSQGIHTVTWFGGFSYNNLQVPPEPEHSRICPGCKAELVDLVYTGSVELPDEEFSLWLDPEGWEVKQGNKHRFGGGYG